MKKNPAPKLIVQRLTLVQLATVTGGSLGGGKSVTNLDSGEGKSSFTG
jgi:homoserine acetyltransferase